MQDHSYTSRRELEEYHFSPVVTLAAPLILLFLQAFLPRVFPPLLILDLPLIGVIFFAVARRSPVAGSLTGAFIGLVQDLLSGGFVGVFGIAKTLIGYLASNIGVRVDVEAVTTRALMNFGFCLLQSGLIFLIHRYLLGARDDRLLMLHELLRAAVNTAVAIPIFLLLDRFKRRD